jgi:hypothetical protein
LAHQSAALQASSLACKGKKMALTHNTSNWYITKNNSSNLIFEEERIIVSHSMVSCTHYSSTSGGAAHCGVVCGREKMFNAKTEHIKEKIIVPQFPSWT